MNFINKTSTSIGNVNVSDSSGKLKAIENELEKTEAFSDHFQKIFINKPAFDVADEITQVSTYAMEMITFCEEDIRKNSKFKVNKSSGPHSLQSCMLFELGNVIQKFKKPIT